MSESAPDTDEDRRLVGWTTTRVDAPVPAGYPETADYYVAVTVAEPSAPFLTVGRLPPLARLWRWVARHGRLGARVLPDGHVPAPEAVERTVAERIRAGLDTAAVAARAESERDLIAASRHDDETAARNRAVPVGRCRVVRRADGEGFSVRYGWFAPFR